MPVQRYVLPSTGTMHRVAYRARHCSVVLVWDSGTKRIQVGSLIAKKVQSACAASITSRLLVV